MVRAALTCGYTATDENVYLTSSYQSCMALQKKNNAPYGAKKFSSVAAYHASFSGQAQQQLEAIHSILRDLLPGAESCISYNMPAFRKNKVLVSYAAYQHHIGFYPTPGPIEAMKQELKGFKTSKGAIQFPLDRPLPLALIRKLVLYRLAEAEALEKKESRSRK